MLINYSLSTQPVFFHNLDHEKSFYYLLGFTLFLSFVMALTHQIGSNLNFLQLLTIVFSSVVPNTKIYMLLKKTDAYERNGIPIIGCFALTVSVIFILTSVFIRKSKKNNVPQSMKKKLFKFDQICFANCVPFAILMIVVQFQNGFNISLNWLGPYVANGTILALLFSSEERTKHMTSKLSSKWIWARECWPRRGNQVSPVEIELAPRNNRNEEQIQDCALHM